jgi:hypothetical protein
LGLMRTLIAAIALTTVATAVRAEQQHIIITTPECAGITKMSLDDAVLSGGDPCEFLRAVTGEACPCPPEWKGKIMPRPARPDMDRLIQQTR